MSVNGMGAGKAFENPWYVKGMWQPSQWMLTMHTRAMDRLELRLKEVKPSQTVRKKFLKGVQWFVKNSKLLIYDHTSFPTVGKWIATFPVRGPLIALLMIGVPASRIYRANKRGNSPAERRMEKLDVLRRDIPAIFFFLYMLDPLIKGLSGWLEKKKHFKLIDHEGEPFKYSQLAANYKIATPEMLDAMLHEVSEMKNGRRVVTKHSYLNAMLDAAKQYLHEKHLPADAQGEVLENFKQHRNTFIERLKNKDAQGAFEAMEHLKAVQKGFFETKERLGGKAALAQVEKAWPQVEDFFVRYAQRRNRLPVDLISFFITAIFIGWIPVQINRIWRGAPKGSEVASGVASPAAPAGTFPIAKAASPWASPQGRLGLFQQFTAQTFPQGTGFEEFSPQAALSVTA